MVNFNVIRLIEILLLKIILKIILSLLIIYLMKQIKN